LRVALAANADLAVAHSTSTLWVASKLLKRGKKVAVDFEDWFSREHGKVPWHPDRLIARLEKEVLAGASHATCTSDAMAEAIGRAYGKKPEVIYNVFSLAEAPQPAPDPGPEGPKVLWISQALGPGRGLETLADALTKCEPVFTVNLVGNSQGDYQKELEKKIPQAWKSRVRFQGQVKDREVMALVARHHIGLALEKKMPVNRDLSVTNKILQYLLGGLMVVATQTQGQDEIATKVDGAVRIVPAGDSNGLGMALSALAKHQDQLKRGRENARIKAEKRFCWEKEKNRLIQIFERSL